MPEKQKSGKKDLKRHFSKEGIYPEEIKIAKDTCTPMFTAALFTIATTWK